jgi:transposase
MRMAVRFVNIDHDTPLLLPPDMRDWVPENHLVHFVMAAVDELDLSAVPVNERGTGSEQYPPRMLLGLLIYSYATGVFSSRQIERCTYDSVATRLLCADTHPDHDTLCTFRRQSRELLSRTFATVLEMAARCGVLRVGGITVAIDGTKVMANASKHSAVSYGHAGETMRELDLEIEQLMRKAELADSVPLEDGLTVPEEIQRREQRKAQLAKARAEIEARAYARAQAERPGYEAKMAKRAAQRQEGKKPRGKDPEPPSQTPEPKDQYNFTDPESRIMKAGSGQHFEQSYNAQAAVEVDSRLIVSQTVCTAPNDKEQLAPTLNAMEDAAGPVSEVLIDSGFMSEKAVRAVESDAQGQSTGITVFAALQRKGHHRTVVDLEKREQPPAPPVDAPLEEQMAHRLATREGRERYKLRKQTVEPVFGIIKEAMGFRRFSLRGLEKVTLEWTLVTLAYNFKRLFHMGAQLTEA